MIVTVKILLFISLLLIFFQDIRQREIWFFLLPIFAITGSILFYNSVQSGQFYYSTPINLAIVSILILINYLFAKFILKKSLFKEVLGLGDLFFFIAFALSFPTLSFINFFVFSLLFSLALQMVVKLFNKSKKKESLSTIPLAGYMAFFLMAVYCTHWLGFYHTIYLM